MIATDMQPQLDELRRTATACQHIWLGLRKVSNFNKLPYNQLSNLINEFKSQHCYIAPQLNLVLRSAGEIIRLVNKSGAVKDLTDDRAKGLPVETAAGFPPHVIFCRWGVRLKTAVVKAVELCGGKFANGHLQTPVTILVSKNMNGKQVAERIGRRVARAIYTCRDGGYSLLSDTQTKMESYLRNPRGGLLTDIASFTGMESKRIVVIGNGMEWEFRDLCLRASVQLTYVIVDDWHYYDKMKGEGWKDGGNYRLAVERDSSSDSNSDLESD